MQFFARSIALNWRIWRRISKSFWQSNRICQNKVNLSRGIARIDQNIPLNALIITRQVIIDVNLDQIKPANVNPGHFNRFLSYPKYHHGQLICSEQPQFAALDYQSIFELEL